VGPEGPPWERPEPRLCTLLERWCEEKGSRQPGFVWVRSLRPPPLGIGGAQIACIRGHEGQVTSVAVSSDGQRIASGSKDKTVRVWDARSGEELECLRGHEGWVGSVAVSPDGRRVVSGPGGFSDDNAVRVWDLESGEELACLGGHDGSVNSVALSPDGRRLILGSHDVKVWDLGSGLQLASLSGHTDPPLGENLREAYEAAWAFGGSRPEGQVEAVAVSPNGSRIVSGGNDRTVRVWDTESGRELACLLGHAGAVSPDGLKIVSAGQDSTVRVWNARSFECVEVVGGLGDVNAIAGGRNAHPFRALERSIEVVIQAAREGHQIAWFPVPLRKAVSARSALLWAGAAGGYLGVIALEGPAEAQALRTATFTRLWRFGKGDDPGHWDDRLTAVCKWHGAYRGS